MVEITDEESARAWLETQPHQVQVWFAVRCALRAVPSLGFAEGETRSDLVFACFRAMLIAVAASTCPATEMKGLESSAEPASDSAASASRSAAHSAARFAAHSAAASTLSCLSARSAVRSAARSAAHSAESANQSAEPDFHVFAHSAAYSAASNDAENASAWARLWHNDQIPQTLATGLEQLQALMSSNEIIWGFWLEWYEAILNGHPLPWELSFRIATTLTDEDWDKGPTHVAERIAEIRKSFDVARAVSDLRGSVEEVAADGLQAHRWHNNPPEPIEEPALVERTTVVLAALDDLEREAKAAEPDKSRARQALAVIRDWFGAVCAYLGSKADRAIDKSIDWGVPAGLGYLVLNPDKLQKVIDLAERWLTP